MIPANFFIGAIIAALFIGGACGYKFTADHYAANELKHYQEDVKRGDDLASRLATSEQQIRNITVWKFKNANKHTTGNPCLSSGAVGLLNNGVQEASGNHDAENAGDVAQVATDRDVLDWSITAQEQYGICAKRLNNLIDYEEGR